MRYAFHEVANIFPMMDDESYKDFVDDIKTNGLREPIWLHDDKIIDGRNRYRACQDAKVEPRFKHWDGNGSLVAFVVSLNLKRRHLSSSQKAAVAVEILPLLETEAKARETLGKKLPRVEEKGKAADHAAAILGTNHSYVTDAKKLKETAPAKFQAVLAGQKTITEVKRELKEEKRESRREDNRAKVAAAPSPKALVGTAKFATIAIDPPWDWGDEGDQDQLGRARPTYATLSIDQIKKLPVGELADEDCHLYLWITNRSLPKGFDLLDAWGFRYVTCLTWCKPSFGMGNYFRGSTEQILFGVKGSQPLKRKDVGTWFQAARGAKGHSSKPQAFYEMVESCSPGPFLEMFSRSDRKGWTHWGESA